MGLNTSIAFNHALPGGSSRRAGDGILRSNTGSPFYLHESVPGTMWRIRSGVVKADIQLCVRV